MTDLYSDYHRKSSSSREDPRLVRRSKNTNNSNESSKQQISPSMTSPAKTTPSHNISDMNWQNQYNSAIMQTAYQHLPPSMYAEQQTQYSVAQGYQSSYGGYQPNYSGSYNPYQGYGQTQSGYNSGSVQPGPPGEEYPQTEWAPVTGYPNMCQPPNNQLAPPVTPQVNSSAADEKEEGVARELKHHKAQVSKEREDYVKKVVVLRRELELLAKQKQDLMNEHSPEHNTTHIISENSKLQIEIQTKINSICNVIELLSDLVGDRRTISDLEAIYKEEPSKSRRKNRNRTSSDEIIESSKYSYIYYDPELHWCRICDVFPKSAKDYLLHLHSKEHRSITQERDMVDTPWHKLPGEVELASAEGGTKKKIPIKGLPFLISASAWYCKLCDTWIGDLHCASQHLKSQNHFHNYTNFVEQNPDWEVDWLKDRDKALRRTSKGSRSDSDYSDKGDFLNKRTKRHKDKSPSSGKKDKKKKKQKKRKRQSSDSSSSSSDSDSSSDEDANDKSKSIHVSMRNKMKYPAQMILNEEVGSKLEVLGKIVNEQKREELKEKQGQGEDKLINQWMTVSEPPEKVKRLFDNLKDRMKLKQDAEKSRLAELEQKRLEKEKREREFREKQERDVREKEEERRRVQEELDKQKEREREQIRFKTRDMHKRSLSPDKNRFGRSRSNSVDRNRHDRTANRYKEHKENRYNGNGRRSPDNKRRSPSYERREKKPAYKKPAFIGRMPLFKNKKNEERIEKEIKKEDYDIPRRSRFQPGNLARAFIPDPDVVCFPKLSCIPPNMFPPPPLVLPLPPSVLPPPPKISTPKLKAPPPPIIKEKKAKKPVVEAVPEEAKVEVEEIIPPPPPSLAMSEIENEMKPEQEAIQENYQQQESMMMYSDPNQMGMDAAAMMQYEQYTMEYNNMMYSHMYDYSQDVPEDNPAPPPPPDQVPVEHTMPLPPPPLPPDDPNEDLAMLGISADDLAVQMF